MIKRNSKGQFIKDFTPWNKGKHTGYFGGGFKKGHMGFWLGKERPNMRGTKHYNWKGGKYKSYQGYWFILNPYHSRANKQGYVKRAILIAEKCLDRYLTIKEVIHHIGDKSDDRPKMLYLFSTKNEHRKYHGNQYIKNKPKLKSNLI